MDNDLKKISINGTMILSIFSLIAYLLIHGFQLSYLSFFEIPFTFSNVNLLNSISYIFIILFVVVITYSFNHVIFSFSEKLLSKAHNSKKFRVINLLLAILFKLLAPIAVPLLFYFTVFQSLKSLGLYFAMVITLIMATHLLGDRSHKEFKGLNEKNAKLLSQNLIWLMSIFIIFYSAGRLYAKGRLEFPSIDSGTKVIIHISSDKIFLKELKDGTLKPDKTFIIDDIKSIYGKEVQEITLKGR